MEVRAWSAWRSPRFSPFSPGVEAAGTQFIETPSLAEEVSAGPPSPRRAPPAGAAERGAARRRRPCARAARRRAAAAHGPCQGCTSDGRLRLCATGRLRPRLPPRSRSPGRAARRGRARLHPAASARPPVVGRPSVHQRGLPLLLGGHRHQRVPRPVRPAARVSGRGRAAALRGARRAHRALHVGAAEPVLPAGAGRCAARAAVCARPLPRGVSRPLRPTKKR